MKSIKNIFDKIPYERIAEFPVYQRWIATTLLPVIIYVAYFFLIQSGKNVEIEGYKANISTLHMDIGKLKRTAKKLPKLEKEIGYMELSLKKARARLPNEKEIPTLLEEISSLGTRVGLEFVTFEPKPEIAEKYYAQVPVNMKIMGSFHNMLKFFYQISKMSRIVTVSDVTFRNAKSKNGSIVVDTNCKATTFRYLDTKTKKGKKK